MIRSLTVFRGMLEHNIGKNNSCNLEIREMILISFKDLMDYLYGKLNEKNMLKYCDALLSAANRYNIASLKDYYEDSLFQ